MCIFITKFRSYSEEIWYSFGRFLVHSTEKFNWDIVATMTTSILVSRVWIPFKKWTYALRRPRNFSRWCWLRKVHKKMFCPVYTGNCSWIWMKFDYSYFTLTVCGWVRFWSVYTKIQPNFISLIKAAYHRNIAQVIDYRSLKYIKFLCEIFLDVIHLCWNTIKIIYSSVQYEYLCYSSALE